MNFQTSEKSTYGMRIVVLYVCRQSCQSTYVGLENMPENLLQLWLSPPQTPHLSNFFEELSLPSQPALIHLPWTHRAAVSGEQGVPSTTWGEQRHRRHRRQTERKIERDTETNRER